MAHVYVDSAASGAGTGADWTNAYTTIAAALAAKAAGDQFWVASSHNATQASTKTFTSPGTEAAPCTVISVNKAGSVPPVAADILAGAIEETTGAFGIVWSTGQTYWQGIILNNSSGATGANIGMNAAGHSKFKSCAFNLLGTASGLRFSFGPSTGDFTETFKDCTFSFSHVNQAFAPAMGKITISGGSICATGTALTGFLIQPSTRTGSMLFEDVDMTNLACATINSSNMLDVVFRRCKTGASFTKTPTTPKRGMSLIIQNASSADVNYELSKYTYEGQHEPSLIVKRTGGASDGTVGLSRKLTTSSGSSIYWPFNDLPIAAWRDSEGSNITVTVECVGDPRHFSALPTNAEFWLDLDYFGTASNPLGLIKSGGPATPLTAGSAYSASTEVWDTGATARANTTVYAAGDVIKLASNPGRIFICTTGGTTAGSEPAGYASAVDGGSVTDNTAVFKAAWRFKAVVATTAAPQNKGFLYITPVMAKASSVIYLDPKLTVA